MCIFYYMRIFDVAEVGLVVYDVFWLVQHGCIRYSHGLKDVSIHLDFYDYTYSIVTM